MLMRILAALTLVAIPQIATAQFRPVAAEVAVGENYRIEAAYGWWDAQPELIVNSESLGIVGTDVDLVSDLGIEKHRLGKFNLVLRPAKKHRLKFERLPISYERDAFPVPAQLRLQWSKLLGRLAGDDSGGLHDLQLRV